MDVFGELLKQGLIGLVAAIAFWLYIQERNNHEKTRQDLMASMLARLDDSKEDTKSILSTVQGVSTSIAALTDKIELARGRR